MDLRETFSMLMRMADAQRGFTHAPVADAASDLFGFLATPAKNIASMFGATPEGHEPPVMFPVGRAEDRWNRGMMNDLAKEGNWKGAMDYAGRVQATEDRQKRNVEDAAFGFAGSVAPGASVLKRIDDLRAFFNANHGRAPTSAEIAGALQVRADQIARDQSAFRRTYPNDAYGPSEELRQIREYLRIR